MDTLEFVESVKQEIAADIREMPDARDALIKILDGEALDGSNPFTCVLDMLAGIAEQRSELEGDAMEQTGQAIQRCATFVEHKIKEPA